MVESESACNFYVLYLKKRLKFFSLDHPYFQIIKLFFSLENVLHNDSVLELLTRQRCRDYIRKHWHEIHEISLVIVVYHVASRTLFLYQSK